MRIFNKLKKLSIASSFVLLCIPAFANNQADDFISDTAITGKIKAGLAANKMTHATRINVETDEGRVILSGKANSNAEANAAIEIAQSTNGVRSVDASKLAVANSKQPLTDSYITSKVKGLFLREQLASNAEDNAPSALAIKVETKDGIVYLKGKVDNTSQLEKAKNLASSVDGVKDVKANLNIKG